MSNVLQNQSVMRLYIGSINSHINIDIKFHHPKALGDFYKDFEFHGLQIPHEEAVAAYYQYVQIKQCKNERKINDLLGLFVLTFDLKIINIYKVIRYILYTCWI